MILSTGATELYHFITLSYLIPHSTRLHKNNSAGLLAEPSGTLKLTAMRMTSSKMWVFQSSLA